MCLSNIIRQSAFAIFAATAFAQEKPASFEIKEGDRVLLLGDSLLEREQGFGTLETRMHEQFPNVKFSVRNLSWNGDTPRGWSRAAFDGPEKGWERLKEQIALVKPTVAILGYGMAASLQEITDRSGDIMLNRDVARYGAEPMSAARFKKELGELMDAIGKDTRFVLLSPIKHEDLRERHPGLPDPAAHNALLEQYSKVIMELAQEHGATFADLFNPKIPTVLDPKDTRTDNGIHLTEFGHGWYLQTALVEALHWPNPARAFTTGPKGEVIPVFDRTIAIRAAVLKKNDLFFHRTRPANSTYLFGFRKHEQGKNAVEIPQFDPLVEAADAEIDRIKRSKEPVAKGSENWGQKDPNKQEPLPIPNFTVQDGYEITLWADSPLVGKPVGMNWDASGRLWVACSPVYPMIAPGAHPDDKVVVLEDSDHDGKADKTTTFASNLLIAAGVAPDFGSHARESVGTSPGKTAEEKSARALTSAATISAAYVGASTELVRLEDTDGDGKADKRRTVLAGFGTEDTHHTLHTLRWGPDGRLYMNQSIYIHSHIETPHGMVRLNSAGILAYDPRTERTEVHAKGWCNPWGHVWDEWGQEFTTDGAGGQGISWLIPGAMYFTYENARRICPSVSPGSYPKFCGLELIRSPLFPADWQGTAVTNDFRAHRVARFAINDLGPAKSGYQTKDLPDLVRTTDSSFRPIDVKLGPDGAIYIADWTNPVINHGEVDFRDPRRDHVNGRIWRVGPKGKAGKWESLVGKKAGELEKMLLSANSWEKAQARAALSHSFRKPEDVSIGSKDDASALAAAYVLAEIDPKSRSQFDDLAGSKNPRYRAMAARLLGMSNNLVRDRGRFLEQLFRDPHPRVRLEAMRSLSKIPTIDDAEAVLEAAVNFPGGKDAAAALPGAPKQQFDNAIASETADSHYAYAAWLSVQDLAPQITEWVEKAAQEKSKPKGAKAKWKEVEEHMAAIDKKNAERIAKIEELTVKLEAMKRKGNPAEAARLEIELAETFTLCGFRDEAAVKTLNLAAAKEDEDDKRDAMISYALQTLPSDKAGPLLSKIIAKNGVPRDGSGPWIELIGASGGPAECRVLLDALLAATIPPSDDKATLADAKLAFTAKDANRRAAAALVAAARRNVKPANPPYSSAGQFHAYGPDEALPDIIRLAGLWKQDFPDAIVSHINRNNRKTIARNEVLDAMFESLRTLGTEAAAQFLTAFFKPELNQKIDSKHLYHALEINNPDLRRRALGALAAFRPDIALAALKGVLTEADEPALLPLWRELFASDPFKAKFASAIPKDLPKNALTAALRAAREQGKKGEKLAAALTPLAGEAPAPAAQDFAYLIDLTKKNGNPVEGEALYRRAASACTVCHAIGGAGGKVGPDMTTLGASAPLDYIIESVMAPAVKVKEGYNAVALTLKGGRSASGMILRDTDKDVLLRDATGLETVIPKGEITGRENIGSLMPAGLLAPLSDREKTHMLAFLAALGKPGPFDATKATVARTWEVYPGRDIEAVVSGKLAKTPNQQTVKALTMVDGRLPKAQFEDALLLMPDAGETIVATARFTGSGKTRLKLTGVTKAWLDGAPLAVASEPNPEVELSAGNHTLAVKLDKGSLPAILRAECADARFLNE